MSQILFGTGSCGFLVEEIQRALIAANIDPKGVDGIYGGDTVVAVTEFQRANRLPVDGSVSEDTWVALVKRPVPAVEERALQLTAIFEGHGFGLAAGNWDGAWLTWGIIGFTMKYGAVQNILLNVDRAAPRCLDDAFGSDADHLRHVIDAHTRPEEQLAWANSITQGSRLAEPWSTGFRLLGTFPEVQKEQLRVAHQNYYLPAINTTRSLHLTTELALALCFDIQVQNGGIKAGTKTAIERKIAVRPSDEKEIRVFIANAVADEAFPRFREDVRQRKLIIATGKGVRGGRPFVLRQFGLGEVDVPELNPQLV